MSMGKVWVKSEADYAKLVWHVEKRRAGNSNTWCGLHPGRYWHQYQYADVHGVRETPNPSLQCEDCIAALAADRLTDKPAPAYPPTPIAQLARWNEKQRQLQAIGRTKRANVDSTRNP